MYKKQFSLINKTCSYIYEKKKDARIRNQNSNVLILKYFGVHRCAGPYKLRGCCSCELKGLCHDSVHV